MDENLIKDFIESTHFASSQTFCLRKIDQIDQKNYPEAVLYSLEEEGAMGTISTKAFVQMPRSVCFKIQKIAGQKEEGDNENSMEENVRNSSEKKA